MRLSRDTPTPAAPPTTKPPWTMETPRSRRMCQTAQPARHREHAPSDGGRDFHRLLVLSTGDKPGQYNSTRVGMIQTRKNLKGERLPDQVSLVPNG